MTVFALWWNWFTILVLWVSPKPDTVTDFRSYSEFLWSMIVACAYRTVPSTCIATLHSVPAHTWLGWCSRRRPC